MFDRIAGVYDVMNTVMTAGLHHQWRSRAVDLARVAEHYGKARTQVYRWLRRLGLDADDYRS